MPEKLAFYFDSSFCPGCKTCQVACKDKHNLGSGVLWRKVYEVAGGGWSKKGKAWVPDVYSYYISMSCNHCQDPVCMKCCPNSAIYRDGRGLVRIDPGKCMGCRYCEWACPYGALAFDPESRKMTKCTMCHDYLEEGRPPACVSACPMRVLRITGDGGPAPSMFPLPDPAITKPNLVINPHPHSLRAEREKLRINNREEVKDGK